MKSLYICDNYIYNCDRGYEWEIMPQFGVYSLDDYSMDDYLLRDYSLNYWHDLS